MRAVKLARATLADAAARVAAGESWRMVAADLGVKPSTLRERAVNAGYHNPPPKWYTTRAVCWIGNVQVLVWQEWGGWRWEAGDASGCESTLEAAKKAALEAVYAAAE